MKTLQASEVRCVYGAKMQHNHRGQISGASTEWQGDMHIYWKSKMSEEKDRVQMETFRLVEWFLARV